MLIFLSNIELDKSHIGVINLNLLFVFYVVISFNIKHLIVEP